MTAGQALAIRDQMNLVIAQSMSADEIDVGVLFTGEDVPPGFIVFVNHPHDGRGEQHEKALPAWLATLPDFKRLDIRCEVLP